MRNEKIDLLRFIGLSMIILAHSEPNQLIFQLRNFDVPLIVLLSGASFGLSFRSEPYIQYVWKRIKRLLFPTWIFLTIYFICIKLNPSLLDIDINNFDVLFSTYFLINGSFYTWIIRVFLLVALIAPFIYQWHLNIKKDNYYLTFLFLILLGYELIKIFTSIYLTGDVGKIINFYVVPYLFYIIPYSVIFALGLRINSMKSKSNYIVLAFSFIVFCGLLLFFGIKEHTFIPTQTYKYPPSIYYFSYAVFISMILWISSHRIWTYISQYLLLKQFILFFARNTLWIYLWHIPIIGIFGSHMLKNLHLHFLIKYFSIYVIAVTITFIQVWFIQSFVLPKINNIQMQKNIKTIFTG